MGALARHRKDPVTGRDIEASQRSQAPPLRLWTPSSNLTIGPKANTAAAGYPIESSRRWTIREAPRRHLQFEAGLHRGPPPGSRSGGIYDGLRPSRRHSERRPRSARLRSSPHARVDRLRLAASVRTALELSSAP